MFLNYELPAELIAQRPVEPRDHARLLVAYRDTGQLDHRHVFDLPDLLHPSDLLIVNDTRVLPARLLGRRERTGGKWEGLFLETRAAGCWAMLSQTKGRLNVGERVVVEPGGLALTLIERWPGQPWLFRPEAPGSAAELLARFGTVPLPPYIRKGRGDDADKTRYQTVFAENPGSVAAPTAGLHFTPELFERLRGRGVEVAKVTLHVGLGTFQALADEEPERHVMHHEWCHLPQATAEAVLSARARGSRVVAVGTTTVRTLESGPMAERTVATDLFIRAPYSFQQVTALMTNFHLPRTTLLLLVGAIAGEPLLRRAYEAAIEERYRFFSYGDAMLIL